MARAIFVIFLLITLSACFCESIYEGQRKMIALDGAEGASASACLTVEFPTPFKAPVSFNMSQGVGPIRDETANLKCSCADRKCDCVGTTEEECDEYAEAWLYFIGMAHQLGFVFYEMSEYNFATMIYWVIFGAILSIVGVGMVLYMEIRTVNCTRQKDERKKLEDIRAMERSNKLILLEKDEADLMKPRAYITTTGAVVFFIGLFCQLVPFCHLLRELGLPVAFPGFCILFVLTSAFMLAATTVLILMGCIWSCTRAFAAMLFVVLGLSGNVIIFYGFLACFIWALVSIAALLLYFKFLPEWLRSDQGAQLPVWLQDIGEFTLEADIDKIRQAWTGSGHLVAHDLANNPLADKRKSPFPPAQHDA